MPLTETDTDAAVIGRDDQDPPRFEGDDLELPSSPEDYLDDKPTAKHTDFEGDGQTVDGVRFDFGGILKGVTDGVSSTAKAVAEVAKAKAASDAAKERGDIGPGGDRPRTPTPKESDRPKTQPTTPTRPVTSGAGYVALAFAGVFGLGTALALAASRKKRRRSAEVI